MSSFASVKRSKWSWRDKRVKDGLRSVLKHLQACECEWVGLLIVACKKEDKVLSRITCVIGLRVELDICPNNWQQLVIPMLGKLAVRMVMGVTIFLSICDSLGLFLPLFFIGISRILCWSISVRCTGWCYVCLVPARSPPPLSLWLCIRGFGAAFIVLMAHEWFTDLAIRRHPSVLQANGELVFLEPNSLNIISACLISV